MISLRLTLILFPTFSLPIPRDIYDGDGVFDIFTYLSLCQSGMGMTMNTDLIPSVVGMELPRLASSVGRNAGRRLGQGDISRDPTPVTPTLLLLLSSCFPWRQASPFWPSTTYLVISLIQRPLVLLSPSLFASETVMNPR